MNALLLTSNTSVPESYAAKLRSWGVTPAFDVLPVNELKGEREADFVQRIAAAVRERYPNADEIDLIQVFFDKRSWPLPSGVKGKQYHAFFRDYQIALVREQKQETAGTAEHEFMHSIDNFCFAYTGVDVAKVVGVPSWDDDIVHRRDPKTKRYTNRYDDVFPIVRPFLEAAIAERRRIIKLNSLQALLNRLLAELRKMQVAGKEPEELPDERETPVERSPEPAPVVVAPMPQPPRKTPAQGLYEAAVASIGLDMSDRAPNELGCADSVNNVHEKAFGFEIGGGASTYLLNEALSGSKRFARVSGSPQAGDVIMSPSGFSSKGAKNGHVGIVGKNKAPDGTLWVMSNDSFKGTWEANFTVASWRDYFGKRLGFPVHIYRLVEA